MSMYPNFARVCFRVDPTDNGIRSSNTLDDGGASPTDELDESSFFDENLEILGLEMQDFDDVDGIDSDVE